MNAKIIPERVLVTVFTISLLLFSSHSWAESKEDFNSWQNTLAPLYLWGVSMSGTMTSGPITAPLEIEFSDAVSDLEAIFTFHYEGAKGNWGIIADYSFLNLGPSAAIPGTPAVINVDMKNTIAEVAGLYRFGPNNPWQLLAGLRTYQLDVTISGLPVPPLPVSQVVIDETINDFFIGGRYVRKINDKWSFLGRADIGAGDSDLVWNAVLAFDYRFTKLLSGFVGWKVLDYDVDRGSGANTFKYDMNHSGPLFALAFHW
jgi:ABC-type amino acid transport substrate-binding protein